MICKCTHEFEEHDETWDCTLCECCMFEADLEDDEEENL